MDANQHCVDAELGQQLTCTLDATAQSHRRLEWADLCALALSSERVTNGVVSTFPLELADDVVDLATREGTCCSSWLTATTQRVGSVIRLSITSEDCNGQATIHRIAGVST